MGLFNRKKTAEQEYEELRIRFDNGMQGVESLEPCFGALAQMEATAEAVNVEMPDTGTIAFGDDGSIAIKGDEGNISISPLTVDISGISEKEINAVYDAIAATRAADGRAVILKEEMIQGDTLTLPKDFYRSSLTEYNKPDFAVVYEASPAIAEKVAEAANEAGVVAQSYKREFTQIQLDFKKELVDAVKVAKDEAKREHKEARREAFKEHGREAINDAVELGKTVVDATIDGTVAASKAIGHGAVVAGKTVGNAAVMGVGAVALGAEALGKATIESAKFVGGKTVQGVEIVGHGAEAVGRGAMVAGGAIVAGTVTVGHALGEAGKSLMDSTKNLVIGAGSAIQGKFLELREFREGKEAAMETLKDLDKWEKETGKMQYELLHSKVIEKGGEEDKALSDMRRNLAEAKKEIVDKGWNKPIYMRVAEKVRAAKETWTNVKDKIFTKIKDAYKDVRDNLVKPINGVIADYAKSKNPELVGKIQNGIETAEKRTAQLTKIVTDTLMPKMVNADTGEFMTVEKANALKAMSSFEETKKDIDTVIDKAKGVGINPKKEKAAEKENKKETVEKD